MYSRSSVFSIPDSLSMIALLTFILLQPSSLMCDDKAKSPFETCKESFDCANIRNIDYYPFWGGDRPGYCGHPNFRLDCERGFAKITILGMPYRVLSIYNDTRVLTVARDDLVLADNPCPSSFRSTNLDFSLVDYLPGEKNLTLLYKCPTRPQLASLFTCPDYDGGGDNYYVAGESDYNYSRICKNTIRVPINATSYETLKRGYASVEALKGALAAGFGLHYLENYEECSGCNGSGGKCGHDPTNDDFACICPDGSRPKKCDIIGTGRGSKHRTLVLAISVVGAVVAATVLGCFVIFVYRQRRRRMTTKSVQTRNKELQTTPLNKGLISTPSSTFTRSIPSYPSSFSTFGKGSSYFGVQVFSYDELEEATDNFDHSKELGEGGFGTVYYGQLKDGRAVAIKRLYENNCKRVEQFMNELDILTRLRHDNLVTLFGCTSRRSRELILVYEYIPNGTVADHLHGKRAKSGLLSWPIRLKIAVETADALAYLHESDIVHRDVKTNNILLDNDFNVKVADFGLSRLFPDDVSHVSTAPQGTPGYVDPEYYQCYQLTEKSDVYSFGVVLVELISSLEAVDICRHRHHINLSNMAINKIQNGALHELVDPSLGFQTNSSVRRMTTLVAELAFRCLQQERDMRPSMDEVVETLGRIQDEEQNPQPVEVVDIMVDDGAPLKGNRPPHSPDSAATDKWVSSSSTTDSSR